MKIIEKPDVSGWSHSCKCKNCETKLEVEAADLHYTHSEGDGIYPASDNYYAQCPICSHHIYVPVNGVPKIVQIEAQKRAPKYSSVW